MIAQFVGKETLYSNLVRGLFVLARDTTGDEYVDALMPTLVREALLAAFWVVARHLVAYFNPYDREEVRIRRERRLQRAAQRERARQALNANTLGMPDPSFPFSAAIGLLLCGRATTPWGCLIPGRPLVRACRLADPAVSLLCCHGLFDVRACHKHSGMHNPPFPSHADVSVPCFRHPLTSQLRPQHSCRGGCGGVRFARSGCVRRRGERRQRHGG